MKRRAGDNIFLIGPMGSGKSTVGRALARMLRWEFVDTDRWVERKAGRTIRAIFARSGEPFFRRLESSAILRAARGRRRVIAVGGGAVISPVNRRVIKSSGAVFYLKVSPTAALRRAKAQGIAKRPLLSGVEGPLKAIKRLMARRRPYYLSCSQFRVRSVGRPESVAHRLAQHPLVREIVFHHGPN